MASRRMFSNRIANSAKFLQMPAESQLLYFHLVLRADDDGIVESYPVTRLLGLAPDNFKVLIAKGFIKQLNEDQVVVITDWHEHNTIRADRKVNSIYQHLLKKVLPEIKLISPKPRTDVIDNSNRVCGQSTDGISKVKLSKVNIHTSEQFNSFWQSYPKKRNPGQAESAWKKINPDNELVDKIILSIGQHKQTDDWKKENGKYIPYPATWLNAKGWEDELDAGSKNSLDKYK